MIQLTRSGTVNAGSPEDLARLRRAFREHHCITLPGLLPPIVVHQVQRQIERAEFAIRVHDRLKPPAIDFCMKPNACSGLLHFLASDPALLALVQNLTGVGEIERFTGSVYRLEPSTATADAWHSDVGGARVLAMSINLSASTYSGGLLQIRERGSGRIVHTVANTGPGDAILFALAPTLQHRVSPLEGVVSRTAFAGWFLSASPDGGRPASASSIDAAVSDPGGERTRTTLAPAPRGRTPGVDCEIRVGPEVFFREEGDSLVLFDGVRGASYALDRVGRRVWSLLGEHRTLRAVMARLADEYDVAAADLQEDVLALVTDLAHTGLVDVADERAGSAQAASDLAAHPERNS